MAVTPEMIQKVRYEVQDTEAGLYILDDSTITYYLEKNNENIQRASLDCARAILMQLALRSNDSTVDIFSIKGSKASSEYRQALQLYINNPLLNPVYNSVGGYAGNISKSDMQTNVDTLDNNAVLPVMHLDDTPTDFFTV